MESVKVLLEKIQHHYACLHTVTLQCIGEHNAEKIPEQIALRENLFKEITRDQSLVAMHDLQIGKQPETMQLRNQIRSFIEKILALDKQVEQIIRRQLTRLNQEMQGLYHSSHAATAYTRQSRA